MEPGCHHRKTLLFDGDRIVWSQENCVLFWNLEIQSYPMSYFRYNCNLRNVVILTDRSFIDYIVMYYNDFSEFHIIIHLSVFQFFSCCFGKSCFRFSWSWVSAFIYSFVCACMLTFSLIYFLLTEKPFKKRHLFVCVCVLELNFKFLYF